jgi:Spy/CpxP family protein refolding chaperone
MKRSFITAAIVFFVAAAGSSVFAYGGKGFGSNGLGGSYMQQELKLTSEQQDKIFKIDQEYNQKFYDNRNNPVKSSDLRNERFKAVYGVLTKEQQEKLAALQANGGMQRGRHR